MSIIAPVLRRSWLPYAAVGAASVLVAAVIAAQPGRQITSPDRTATVAAPGIEQAPWKTRTVAAGALNKPGRAAIARVKKHGAKVSSLIAGVYDALFLEPETFDTALRKRFQQGAARALLASNAGLPKGAGEVQILSRRAVIGIDAATARYATARARFLVKGTASKGDWRLLHRSKMWLERSSAGWRVIAFEVDQIPRGKK